VKSACINKTARTFSQLTQQHCNLNKLFIHGQQWIKACMRQDPINVVHASVCCSHFLEDDYERDLVKIQFFKRIFVPTGKVGAYGIFAPTGFLRLRDFCAYGIFAPTGFLRLRDFCAYRKVA
jgi:hypothetical protein